MKNSLVLIIFLFLGSNLAAQVAHGKLSKSTLAILHADSIKHAKADSALAHSRDSAKMALMAVNLAQQAKLMSVDSLRQLIKHTNVDTLKAPLYTEMALRFMVFDTLNEAKNHENQNNALSYTMLALHQYSAYGDAIGMRLSYDNLAKLYLQQGRFSEAKWYALQSNNLSRNRNDVVNMIATLLILADIKGQIRDYKLAQHDLTEAMGLAVKTHNEKLQLQIIKTNALLYSRMKDYDNETLMLKKQEALEKKIQKEEAAKSAPSAKKQVKSKPVKKPD